MISEERLKEIIEQQGTIYCSSSNVWYPIRFSEHEGRIRNGYFEYRDFCWSDYIELNRLFETEEEAEEYTKYGNITRTEKLELPTWKEIQDIFNEREKVESYFCYTKYFHKPNRNSIDIDYSYSIYLSPNGHILIDDNEIIETLYAGNFTKEDWDKARDLAVKLFKGEEV